MNVSFRIQYSRPDRTVLTREVSVGSQNVYQYGGFRRETKPEFAKRVRRLVEAAIVGTVGR